MSVGLLPFLVLGAVLFTLGLYGALSRRSGVTALMSLAIMAAAANINLVAFSRFVTPAGMTGQLFSLFALAVTTAELGLGVAIVLRTRRGSRSDEPAAPDRRGG